MAHIHSRMRPPLRPTFTHPASNGHHGSHLAVRDPSLQSAGYEWGGLLGLIGLYLFAGGPEGREWNDTVNVIGPSVLIVLLSASAYRMLRQSRANIWAALFWFRIATAIYFGFGQIVPLLLNAETYMDFMQYHETTPGQLTSLNLLVTIGMLCIILGARLLSILAPPQSLHRDEIRIEPSKTLSIGLVFLLTGAVLKYLYVFPYSMGWTKEVLPTAIASFSALLAAGIYLLTLWALKSRLPWALPLVILIVAFDMLTGLVLMTKYETLLPLLVFCIGVLTHRVTIHRLALIGVVFFSAFTFLVPLVSEARDSMYRLGFGYTDRGGAGIEWRLHILIEALNPESVGIEDQSSIMRLSYANTGGFLMARYDAGFPGNSLEHLFATFIPRLLWPDKPILNFGQQMSILITGFEDNAVGAGLYFESYWNFGWLGPFVMLVPYGLLLGALSRYAVSVVSGNRWHLLPVLFLCMKTGIAPDDYYVGQIGSIVIIFCMHIFLVLMFKVIGEDRPAGNGQLGGR